MGVAVAFAVLTDRSPEPGESEEEGGDPAPPAVPAPPGRRSK